MKRPLQRTVSVLGAINYDPTLGREPHRHWPTNAQGLCLATVTSLVTLFSITRGMDKQTAAVCIHGCLGHSQNLVD